MAGTVVLLLSILVGLSDIFGIYLIKAQNETLSAADPCTAPWNATVAKDLYVQWEGDPREGDVRVTIEIIESNGANCLNKTSFSEKFDEEGPPFPGTPCLNSAYRVVAELLCKGKVISNFTKVVWTEPDVPSNVRAIDVTPSSFRIIWDPPPGPVEEYKVNVNSEELIVSDTSILVQNLEPDTLYDIAISAWNKYEWGSLSKAITIKTKEMVPLEPQNLITTDFDSITIRVKWTEPTPNRGPIQFYTVKWTTLDSGTSEEENTNDTSYIIQNLTPLTSYEISVSATNSAGTGNWSSEIKVLTKPPVPPENLKQVAVNSSSVTIRWDEPNIYRGKGILVGYSVMWNQRWSPANEIRNTTGLSMFIDELEPSTDYIIKVRAWTEKGYGEWTGPLLIETTVGVPWPPENVHKEKVTSNSIGIKWDVPTTYKKLVLQHSVRWREVNSRGIETADTKYTSYTIRNLEPFTNYSIQVRSSTKDGPGDWADPIIVQTDTDEPSVPRNLRDRIPATNTTIEIEWEEPKPANGPILNYTVRWTNLNNNTTKYNVTKNTIYVLTHLSPYTNHSIQVRAATTAGYSAWTEELVLRTDIGVPHQPKDVKVLKCTDTSIYLTWKEPLPLVGYVSNYIVEWTNVASNESKREKVENSYYTIKNLSPYTKYSIRIIAETAAGLGKWSDSVENQTLSGVPTAPRNIQQSKTTNLTICLKWDEPVPFTGPIMSYVIRWRRSIDVKNDTGSTNTSSYCISNLQPYTVYQIGVRAETEAGFGPWSETRKIQTAIGLPTIVQNLTMESKTAWSIHLTWLPPDPSNGPLKNYEVKWGKGRTMTTSDLTDVASFKANNLIPYTEYTFQVSASTAAGFGFPSDPLTIRTGVAAPSSPLNLTLVSASNLTLGVKWKIPREPNGPILGYKVKWVKTFENVHILDFEVQSLQYVIHGLDPYNNYSIQVSARTSAGSGPWTDVLVASTKIGIPKPAQLLDVHVESSRTIVVEWSTLNPYPGPTNYTLEVWRKSDHCHSSVGVVQEKTIVGPRGSGEWKFSRQETVEDLIPYSDYYVRILLKTVVDGSQSVNSKVVRTLPDSPGPPRQVEADCKESTETEVRWKSPMRPNGKIIEYLVRYGVEYQGWNDEAVAVNNECNENHRIRLVGLRPERKYKIYVRAKAENVEENGAEASLKGYCILPAGIPSIENINYLKIQGSGPHNLILEWSQDVFSDSMGELVNYAVIIGTSEAVGNATSGRISEMFPTWSNYSEGSSNFYQATPLDWNPFNLDEEKDDPLQCTEKGGSQGQSIFSCILGIENGCSEDKPYCNGKLKPDTRYGVKIRAFTRGGFSETDPLFANTDPIKETSSLIGIIIGIVLVLILVSAFIVGTVILRRKGKLAEFGSAIFSRLGQQPTAPSLPPEQVLQLETCATVKTLNIRNFADHVRLMMSDSHLRFSQEFETLKKNSPKFPCTAAEMDENRPKNRWLNIFPYDHSRVKLLPLGDEPGSDFVNANYIPGYSSLREYIATQGPLANTVDDFWRMIWEQSVSMIVMLTQCVERGKNKCEQYWPDAGEAKHYGDMQVRTISESMLSSYIIRLYHVQLGSQERRVKQMHFTHWPDFGCPESPDDLINFIRAVRDHLPRIKPGPIIVHCSAGVGRTGTFIAVDRLSQQLRNTDAIDIFGTVMELRHHRINMVQTEDQYIYIHLCIKQLVDDINEPRENEYEDSIYSNIGMEKDTGL
ncbi:phosphatidylinositol phosphatase PTPRQ [Nephila pilipes]|uniref:protein-tyrosine-phosphatase n=1 Tax=Nephila pilipes TaxID=299642 RepID=A0A8X6UED2_NEPPI|nr:phosphatidylinositol phosphatase PTPRQ [Nephila pilipes]